MIKSRNKSFYSFYPSQLKQTQLEFENDIDSVKYGERYERTQENIRFFKETDIDITKPFKRLLPELNNIYGKIYLYLIIYNPLLLLTSVILKLYYNRARPYQVSSIKPLESKTSKQTPSYPSSHAVQAYALAKRLTKKYPEKTIEINELAERIADIRRIGGVHFPSDKKFAKVIVNRLPWL